MRFARPDRQESNLESDRPDLAAVFEYYDVPISSRRSQMVLCPVHDNTRSPSCSVNLDKQLFHCHSCDAGGSAWDLIMQKEGLDFDGARAFAAAQQFPTGDAGGGDSYVPAGRFGSRRKVPERKGNRSGRSSYRPSWRSR